MGEVRDADDVEDEENHVDDDDVGGRRPITTEDQEPFVDIVCGV